MNETHRQRFTIIGNHLAQHRELSLTAIGLATHIQSLPEGASVDILTLAGKFAEGRNRVASALRELEAHGYLERVRERTPEGRIVTRTISYNHPESTRARLTLEAAAHGTGQAQAKPVGPRPAARSSSAAPARPSSGAPARRHQRSRAVRGGPTAPPAPRAAQRPAPSRPARPTGPLHAPAEPEPALVAPAAPEPEPAPAPAPAPSAQARPTPPPLPAPQAHDPERHTTAITLLAGLHRDAPQLLLPERDVHRLAPAVAAWLERGATPDAVHHTLTNGLPTEPRHPAALLAHRLTDLLPPPLPAATRAARPDPLQNCEDCDRAYRAPAPGKCRDCLHTTTAPPAPPADRGAGGAVG
ncbi:hypothetical protein [Streptomyces sp. NPDC088725]|uniref:hypothetical protein n=1 Tax=Streptomyces sp. NPDC088725 TaxID=3365873 RepID=UPI0037FB1C61